MPIKRGSSDISSVNIGASPISSLLHKGSEILAGGLFLQSFEGAVVAYSLRKLSSSYSGSSIRVLRESDDSQQDIGFVDGELDVATLESFCSGTNGRVTVWYDQSGSGVDLTPNSITERPVIFTEGSIIREGTKPAIDISSGQRLINAAASIISGDTNSTIISVQNVQGSNEYVWGFGDESTGGRRSLKEANGNARVEITGTGQETDIPFDPYSLAFLYNTGPNFNTTVLNVNSTSQFNFSDSGLYNTQNGLCIGERSTDLSRTPLYDGTIQELIAYTSDKSANRSSIESNINGYYGIY